MKLQVHNADATMVILAMDEDSAELRGFELDQRFPVVDVTTQNQKNVTMEDKSHPDENKFIPFIAGTINVPQGHSVIGWIAFEVPISTKLKELRWDEGGDVIFLD